MATNIYSFYKQMHPPTTVEHCLYCNFYNSWEQNLLIAGATVLRIYRLVPESEVPTTGEPKLKLECYQIFPLFGNIMSMKAVRLAGSPRDALLLSFKDPKAGATHHPFVPEVRVDPDARCAAMVVYERSIVILPFRKDTITEEPEIASGSAHIPSGMRIAVRDDTCAILALSLNINPGVHPIIWTVSGLPSDCLYSTAVPKPIGNKGTNSICRSGRSSPRSTRRRPHPPPPPTSPGGTLASTKILSNYGSISFPPDENVEIKYFIRTSLSEEVKIIRRAFSDIEIHTRFIFNQSYTPPRRGIYFAAGNHNSTLGDLLRCAKPQITLVKEGLRIGVVVHEALHAMGVPHEHQRNDRDSFIEVVYRNIIDGFEDQFFKNSLDKHIFVGHPYDTLSLMHYGMTSFSKHPRRRNCYTIKPRIDKNVFVPETQPIVLSRLDIKKLNAL